MSVDPDNYGWKVDLQNMVIHWDGGLTTKIVELLDAFGEDVDSPQDAIIITTQMPPDMLCISFDLRDVCPDHYVDPEAAH